MTAVVKLFAALAEFLLLLVNLPELFADIGRGGIPGQAGNEGRGGVALVFDVDVRILCLLAILIPALVLEVRRASVLTLPLQR